MREISSWTFEENFRPETLRSTHAPIPLPQLLVALFLNTTLRFYSQVFNADNAKIQNSIFFISTFSSNFTTQNQS